MQRKLCPVFVIFLVIMCHTIQGLDLRGKTKRSRNHFVYNGTQSVLLFPDPHQKDGVIEARMERNPNMTTKSDPGADIFYHLYTASNFNSPFVVRTWEDLFLFPYAEHFGPETNYVMLMHGFGSDCTSNPATRPTLEALMNHYGPDTVLLVCDWSPLAAAPWYMTAAENTDVVGWYSSLLINAFVVYYYANPLLFHLVGFSLGAHCAGNTGWYCKNYWGFELGYINGLDAAGPLFEDSHPDWCLDRTDAAYVEAIHTCAGYLGAWKPYGHVDFYPDGGTPSQTACSWWYDASIAYACSHSEVCTIFTNSLKGLNRKYYAAYPCDSLQAVEDETCQWTKYYEMSLPSQVPYGIYYAYP